MITFYNVYLESPFYPLYTFISTLQELNQIYQNSRIYFLYTPISPRSLHFCCSTCMFAEAYTPFPPTIETTGEFISYPSYLHLLLQCLNKTKETASLSSTRIPLLSISEFLVIMLEPSHHIRLHSTIVCLSPLHFYQIYYIFCIVCSRLERDF